MSRRRRGVLDGRWEVGPTTRCPCGTRSPVLLREGIRLLPAVHDCEISRAQWAQMRTIMAIETVDRVTIREARARINAAWGRR